MENKVIKTSFGNYLVIKEIKFENNMYVFLTNVNNEQDSFFALIVENKLEKIEDTKTVDKLLAVIASEEE